MQNVTKQKKKTVKETPSPPPLDFTGMAIIIAILMLCHFLMEPNTLDMSSGTKELKTFLIVSYCFS